MWERVPQFIDSLYCKSWRLIWPGDKEGCNIVEMCVQNDDQVKLTINHMQGIKRKIKNRYHTSSYYIPYIKFKGWKTYSWKVQNCLSDKYITNAKIH